MFDFAWSEMAVIGVVALLLIGPKDMPVAIRTVTGLIKKGRKLASEFQSHVDEMVRDADLTEARDQLNRMRRLNVRNQIMQAIDGDGTIRRTIEESPLDGTRAGPADLSGFDPGGLHEYGYATPVASYAETAFPPAPDAGPPPALLPPSVARRLAAERARLHPPAFLPPVRVIHGARRVSVTAPDVGAPAPHRG
ncbi:twin-arginine translocation protein, TatB subunit [Gluconacetobacter diazotrophicus PA1 5]|uniref:Sec-independent protein translocase protein TatB n=1 Tax=Gluconacetobacter diazotrophicus TaxID=33996 RepID=UPI000173D843|nr:Sec-independent protein translocase protein TatB [Gluconacetobacter diazotrophicus]ACI50235.1 twin-arginine translocation protein, TatB subunit [Gluconacetobacter diazotrophicus PA1 5]TWB08009.1 sec-independent protein translocase protein TatB [Gluconacetobacter diazotrophicus]